MSDQAYESFQMMTQAQRDKPDVNFEGNSRCGEVEETRGKV
jgi:hypothetical protein